MPCPNRSPNPESSFQFSLADLHHWLEKSELIWHTHITPNSNYLSYADIQLARTYNKPILSYEVNTGAVDFYDPSNAHPFPILGDRSLEKVGAGILPRPTFRFEGLPYRWNRCDCHHLVRAWYEIELGIKLPPISFTEAEEYELGQPYYTKAIEQVYQMGFVQISDSEIEVGTLVLMCMASENPHHCGVITHRGEDGWMMLHHRTDAVSEVTRLRKYRSFVHSYWKLPNIPSNNRSA